MGIVRSKGFSLAEVLASLALLAIIFGIGVGSLQRRSKGSPPAMATLLAEQFRAAQARSQAKGYPIGIGFPSNEGAISTCQAHYQMEGHVFPRISRVKQFEKENPGIYFGLVHWSGRGTATVDQAVSDTDFLLESWGLETRDPILIFLPDGSITSNGVAHTDGLFSVVVSDGFRASSVSVSGEPGTTQPGASFRLDAARNPVTVTLSSDGAIFVEPGLPRGASLQTTDPIRVKTVVAPVPSAPASAAPEILSHKPFPEPVEPIDTDAVVPIGGSLTLEAEAWSPTGSPLFATWEGPGAFSSPEGVPMKWDPLAGNWKAQVEWHPPKHAVVGDQLELAVKVNDEFGNTNAAIDVDPVDVEVGPRVGLISYRSNSEIRLVLENGSGDESVATGNLRYPNWSPDASKLVATDGQNLKLIVPDVGVVRTVTTENSYIYRPKWSPDGTRILYTAGGKLWVVAADGSSKTELSNLPTNRRLAGGYGWHPNGDRIIFCTLKTHSVWTGEIWTVKRDGTDKRRLSDGSYIALYASYSPILPGGEVKAAFYGYGGKCHGIFITDDDFSANPQRLRGSFWTSVSNIWQIGWSHDGSWLSCYGGPLGQPWTVKGVNVQTKKTVEYPNSNAGHTWGVWSPYAPKVLFRGSGNSLTICDADGAGRKDLTTKAAYESDWVR
jgi:prepilin-type N-terminal cleavage/methylation domain-containing protein